MATLLVTVGFAAAVASFPATAVAPLAPYLLFPVLCASVGNIPAQLLARRALAVLPFAAAVGIAGPVLDRTPMLVSGGLVVARGWMSLAGIAFRTVLIVSAATCLAALCGFEGIARALERLRLPRALVLPFRLMFRHISTLSEEVGHTVLAYRLRSRRDRGILARDWGNVAGSVLVRSIDRAERIHTAMLVRGGAEPAARRGTTRLRATDWLFLGCWYALFIVCRIVDVPLLLGTLAGGAAHG